MFVQFWNQLKCSKLLCLYHWDGVGRYRGFRYYRTVIASFTVSFLQRYAQFCQIHFSPFLIVYSIRLADPSHGMVTKTVYETLPGGGGSEWVQGVGSRQWWGSSGVGV